MTPSAGCFWSSPPTRSSRWIRPKSNTTSISSTTERPEGSLSTKPRAVPTWRPHGGHAMAANRHTSIVNLDHIGAAVRDLKAARTFYGAALGAIGMKINMDVGRALGVGPRTQKIFWLGRDRKASGSGHYAFRVDHRREVDAFYDAAMASGGK